MNVKVIGPITLAGLLYLAPLAGYAQDYTYFTNNGAITITSYEGPGGNVIIPGTINGLPVTSIGDYAFLRRRTIADVTIPNSVTNIGDRAFLDCDSLIVVTIPNNVTSIGPFAFSGCTNLTNLTIGENVTRIREGAFYGCSSLTTISVDVNNLTYSSLEGVLFDKNRNTLVQFPTGRAGDYTVPNSVSSIGSFAFWGCAGLASVTIPGSVTSIGGSAFSGCTSLFNITIPVSVTGIGSEVFMLCSSLSTITVDVNNPAYSSVEGVLFDKNGTTLIQFPAAKAGNYIIPSGVTSIGELAFFRSTCLTDLPIPNSVTNIGEEAFRECRRLSTVTMGPSVRSIEAAAFMNCTSLTNVTLPNGLSSMGSWAFWGCTNLAAVTMGESITSIADRAFGSTRLTNVAIPNSVKSIGEWAFHSCGSLTNVTIPGSVRSMGSYAFSSCCNLTQVYFRGNPPTYVGRDVFVGTTNLVYYLPGTTGWGVTFAGRPTAPWQLPQPLILTFLPEFGMHPTWFSFRVSWATNTTVVLEVSTSPGGATWLPIATNALLNGWTDFSDPQWKNHPARFYRVRSH